MTGQDKITMSQTDLKRLHVIHKAMDKAILQIEAADTLGLCVRQVQRIIGQIRSTGDKGILHKSLGKPSNNRTDEKVKTKAMMLYKTHYPDFGPTLGSEKLWERHKIKINDETLRLWLIKAGIAYDRRKPRPHRQWRERKPSFGQMTQMDGSHHDWLEERGPKLVLMAYKDDAKSKVFARFYEYEGTFPAMDSLMRYIQKYGIPQSIYLDKHSTYKSWGKPSLEEELKNTHPMTQFERAARELGIEVIWANSPQAKGRIERQFRTFQHRLVKELRLFNAKTLKEANKVLAHYLPKFNRRFEVAPQNNTDLHRPAPKGLNLRSVFCIKEDRVLRNDWTISYNTKLYQILDEIKTQSLEVQEWLDGSLHLSHKGLKVRFKEVNQRPKKEQAPKPNPKTRVVTKPAMDHPWRQYPVKLDLEGNSLHLNTITDTITIKKDKDAGLFSSLSTVFTKRKKEAKKEKELLLVH
jgi:transposase